MCIETLNKKIEDIIDNDHNIGFVKALMQARVELSLEGDVDEE